jgi:hypothetical protein
LSNWLAGNKNVYVKKNSQQVTIQYVVYTRSSVRYSNSYEANRREMEPLKDDISNRVK